MAANPQPGQPRLNKAGRRSGGLRKPRGLTPEELAQIRQTEGWDVGDGRKIVCLICGVKMWGLGPTDQNRPGHLWHEHQMTPKQYAEYCQQQGWGCPPVTSLHIRDKSRQWRNDHPDEVKVHNSEHRERDQKNLTDTDRANRVECRLCGVWLRNLVTQHLPLVHGISTRRYLRRFPGAQLMAPDLLDAWEKASKIGQAKLFVVTKQVPKVGRKTTKEKGVEKIYVVIGRIVSRQTDVFDTVLAVPRAQWGRNGFSAQIQYAASAALTSRGATKDRPRIAARYMVASNPKMFGLKAEQLEYDTVAKYDREYLSGK